MDNIILIPAYKPDKMLVRLIQQIKKINHTSIVIVNNGNGSDHNFIFNKLQYEQKLHIPFVKKNKGKGYGIKFGINYILKNLSNFNNIIFVDADGQHTKNDIQAIIAKCATLNMKKKILIGERKHTEKTPTKNYLGNTIYNFLIKRFKKINLNDCLCGLRAISAEDSKFLLNVKENGFDFEVTSLFYLKNLGFEFDSVQISATYYEDHKTHFKDIQNSLELLKLIVK